MALPTHRAIDSVVGLYMLGWGTGPIFRPVHVEVYVQRKDHLVEGQTPPGAAQDPSYDSDFTPQDPGYVTP